MLYTHIDELLTHTSGRIITKFEKLFEIRLRVKGKCRR